MSTDESYDESINKFKELASKIKSVFDCGERLNEILEHIEIYQQAHTILGFTEDGKVIVCPDIARLHIMNENLFKDKLIEYKDVVTILSSEKDNKLVIDIETDIPEKNKIVVLTSDRMFSLDSYPEFGEDKTIVIIDSENWTYKQFMDPDSSGILISDPLWEERKTTKKLIDLMSKDVSDAIKDREDIYLVPPKEAEGCFVDTSINIRKGFNKPTRKGKKRKDWQ